MQRALAVELDRQGLCYERQKRFQVIYCGRVVGDYVADFVVERRLLVEIKAVQRFAPEHKAQVLNYLKAANLSVGLLLNFGVPRVAIQRVVRDYHEHTGI